MTMRIENILDSLQDLDLKDLRNNISFHILIFAKLQFWSPCRMGKCRESALSIFKFNAFDCLNKVKTFKLKRPEIRIAQSGIN